MKIGDKVKYKQSYLDCFKGKEQKSLKEDVGEIIEIYGIAGIIKWNDGTMNSFPLFDLEILE